MIERESHVGAADVAALRPKAAALDHLVTAMDHYLRAAQDREDAAGLAMEEAAQVCIRLSALSQQHAHALIAKARWVRGQPQLESSLWEQIAEVLTALVQPFELPAPPRHLGPW